jgi:hypothetical protein
MTLLQVLIILAVGLAFVVGRWRGIRAGRQQEKMRCMRLCDTALHKRWSGSVRWVLNAIESDKIDLMPGHKFFEKGDDV